MKRIWISMTAFAILFYILGWIAGSGFHYNRGYRSAILDVRTMIQTEIQKAGGVR